MGSSSLEAYKVNYWTGILHTQQDYGCWLHKETNTDDAGGKEMRHILELIFVFIFSVGYVFGVRDGIVSTQESSSMVMSN